MRASGAPKRFAGLRHEDTNVFGVVDASCSCVAVRVNIDRDARLVRSTFSGHVTILDFFEGRMRVVEHPDHASSFVHVIDLTAVTNVDVPDATLKHIAEMRPLFEPDTLQIVVVTSDSPIRKFVAMFQGLAKASRRNVQIVASLEEANALLAARKKDEPE